MSENNKIQKSAVVSILSNPLIEVLLRSLVLVILAYSLAEMFIVTTGMLFFKANLLLHMCLLVVIAFLLFPKQALQKYSYISGAFIWAVVNFILLCLVAAITLNTFDLTVMFTTGFAGAIVLLFMMSSVHFFQLLFSSKDSTAPFVTLLLFLIFSAMPVWLGPWAEYHENGESLSNIIIALSPISYFSVMLDYDYLRGAWFYEHTPFGSLRFEYLSPVIFSVIFLVCIIVLLAFSHFLRRKKFLKEMNL